MIGFSKGKGKDDDDEEADADAEADAGGDDSGSKVKLRTWAQRKGKSMGYEAPGGKPIPLIDRIHRLMHLWKAGELSKVDDYIDGNGLRRQELFKRLLQSLIELSPHGSEERSLMESISNHLGARGAMPDAVLPQFAAPAGGMRNEEQEKHDDPRELHRLGVRHLELLEQARRTTVRAVNSVLTATYWEIGRRIVEFEQGGKETSEYGEKLLERISADLTARHGRGFPAPMCPK